jgi:NADH-quinone oxidoreductase subunit F
VTDTLTPVLTAHWDQPDSFTLDGYAHRRLPGAAQGPRHVPDEVIQTVKDSGLRGRGGAGFPTGVKWGFIPQGDGKPHYLVVNADESEPGACKDIPLMMANPHVLIEGIIIACYAIRASHAFIYVRGEVLHVIRRLQHAVAEAYEAGYLGQDILGSGLRPRRGGARRGRRLHLRRGDRAAGLAGGLPRPAAEQAAVPGRGRACTPARRTSTTSSRSPACRRSC